jgi:hypothetical protein
VDSLALVESPAVTASRLELALTARSSQGDSPGETAVADDRRSRARRVTH